ncbi:hypothetical protein, partial [Kitasatospora sp. NPDC059571]|uniref:hypothetical protein n=1 Tax=Kitasatospora sp. NPDC059571 TaxID=3346871 RepID=UPI0036A07FBA
MMPDESAVDRAVAALRAAPRTYCSTPLAPHPRAAELVLPNGERAPRCLRLWAGFDNRYPLHGGRSSRSIADGAGVLLVEPMESVLRRVCIESIEDDIDDHQYNQGQHQGQGGGIQGPNPREPP